VKQAIFCSCKLHSNPFLESVIEQIIRSFSTAVPNDRYVFYEKPYTFVQSCGRPLVIYLRGISFIILFLLALVRKSIPIIDRFV